MGFLQDMRFRILEELREQLDCAAAPVGLPSWTLKRSTPATFEFEAEQVASGHFQRIEADTPAHRAAPRGVRVGVDHVSVDLIEACTIKSAAMQLEATVQVLPQYEAALVRTISVPLPFEATVKRFHLRPQRREPASSVFAGTRPTERARRLDAVARKPVPPIPAHAGLEERLALLLAPPIQAVLSDATLVLPDKPYRYQLDGIQWLYDRRDALLADEMGLGKTMQAILAARLLWRDQQILTVLVLCPASLRPNWRREICHWWPEASDHIVEVGKMRRAHLASTGGRYIFKIVSFHGAARETEWLQSNAAQHDLVIIDEAHLAKGSVFSKAVRALRGKRNWVLTGTPLQNNLDELRVVFDFVVPGLLKKGMRTTEINERKAPFFLRREAGNESVGLQLPEIVDEDVLIELTEAQREAYDRAENEGVIALNQKGEEVTVHHVFQLIQKLQQLCNFEPVSGESGKTERLLEELKELEASGRKALIFSQFVDERFGLKRLSAVVRPKHNCLEFHGEIEQRQREAVLAAFQSDQDVRALLLSYGAGGTGLNLTAATYVFLFNRWWNPAVEEQALKRAHRIGQRHPVIVRRFVCADTIEERIVRTLAAKRFLFSNVVATDNSAASSPLQSTGLTEEEVFALFNLKVRPKRVSSKPRATQLVLENISPTQFEELVARIFEAEDYIVVHTGGSHDGGVDVRATKVSAGGKDVLAIQCKRYSESSPVGVSTIRELWGTISHDPTITHGVLATTSRFSPEAKEFAKGKRIRLMDRTEVIALATKFGIAEFVSDGTK